MEKDRRCQCVLSITIRAAPGARGSPFIFLIHNCYSCQCAAVSGSLHAPAAFAKNPLVSHESSIIPLLSEEVKLFQLMENLFTLLTI